MVTAELYSAIATPLGNGKIQCFSIRTITQLHNYATPENSISGDRDTQQGQQQSDTNDAGSKVCKEVGGIESMQQHRAVHPSE